MNLTSVSSKTYYELLGVSENATPQQIREVYRELARVYHPDSNYYADIAPNKVSVEQIELFKIITAAYQTLIDPAKRSEYDSTISSLTSTKLKRWEDSHDDFWGDRQNTNVEASMTQTRTRKMTFGQTGARPYRGTMHDVRAEPSVTEVIRMNSKRRARTLILMSFGLILGLAAVVGIVIGATHKQKKPGTITIKPSSIVVKSKAFDG